MMYLRKTSLALCLAAFSSLTLAEVSLIDDDGYLLDDSYYQEVPVDSPVMARSSRNTQPASEAFEVSLLNKGGFLANYNLQYQNPDGSHVNRRYELVGAGQRRNFHVPQGVKNVQLRVNILLGFDERQIIARQLTNDVVAQGDPDLVEYHLWGTTFHPRWRMMR